MTKAIAINPAEFLGAKVLSPMEQDAVRGGRMTASHQQQQQQQQQQQSTPSTPSTPQPPRIR